MVKHLLKDERMQHQPKILVAGYGAWAKAERNPAAQVATILGQRRWKSCEVIGHVMPVDSAALARNISTLLEAHRPAAWIGLGISQAAIVQTEMVGINWRDFDVPDASGAQIRLKPIDPDGPVGYNATLPNAAMVEAMKEAGIPAALSFGAGTHLCNQMLYTAARLIAQQGLPTLSGFIHIPQSPENVASIDRRQPRMASMSLAMAVDAIALCIDTLAKALTAQPTETA